MAPGGGAVEPVRFGRDVRPILSDRCFLCHGPDREHRAVGLRLDSFADATAPRPGGAAIVPGRPGESMLLRRAADPDPDRTMPPPESGKHALTAAERALLARWIAQGAEYEPHWAFVPPAAIDAPGPEDPEWSASPIDRFVHAGLVRAGFAPSPEADRATLCRRVYLDLTGLPPTPQELNAFITDARADAYERLVDRLLTEEPYRTRHAERMAVPWLDVARYADTSGIHMDAGRQMWLWRDWVISAFRDNMPYDRFVVEQVAGDLLPNATDTQRIATGFLRAHVTSDEGGAIDAEYLLEYAADRATTVGSAFLGLTMQCARCHDHKFDPVTQEDFYGLLAFFNSNDEPGIYSQVPDANRALEPFIDVPTPEHRARADVLRLAAAAAREERERMDDGERAGFASFAESLGSAVTWVPTALRAAEASAGVTLETMPDGSVRAVGDNPADVEYQLVLDTPASGWRALLVEALPDAVNGDRPGRAGNGNAVLESIEVEVSPRDDPSRRVVVPLAWAWADVEQPDGDHRVTNALAADGREWALDGHRAAGGRTALFVTEEPVGFPSGTEVRVRLVSRSPYPQHALGRVRVRLGVMTPAVAAALPPASSAWYICGPFPVASGAEGYEGRFGPEAAEAIDLQRVFGSASSGEFRWRHAPGVLEAQPVRLAEGIDAEFVAREVWCAEPCSMELSLGSDDGMQVFVNGRLVHERRIDRGVAADQERITVPLRRGRNLLACKVVNTGGAGGFYHRELPVAGRTPREAVALMLPADRARPTGAAGAESVAARDAWRAAHSTSFGARDRAMRDAEAALAAHEAQAPRTMVMRERAEPTPTFVLKRGLYDHADPDRPVERQVPAVLGALPPDAPRNRLGLARWLVGEGNPLTARVVVNRFWEQFFGRGLVRSSEDFGLQGEWPTHPELLDWLAVDFRANGWDVRRLVRQIVTSATYRQSSRRRPDVAEADPEQRLLGWFPRQRLAAEQIRDQALHAAGLLRERMGGPSARPYQPAGLWEETSMPQSNTRTYAPDQGDGLWRRSLYTYWKRASPPPSMLALDAPTREFCTVRRFVTNTPLQALVLWNDPQFVEAARVAAERTLGEGGGDAERMASLWMRLTAAPADAQRLEVLLEALRVERERWSADRSGDAERLLAVGQAPRAGDIAPQELAAWTMIANAILASDAAIVKD